MKTFQHILQISIILVLVVYLVYTKLADDKPLPLVAQGAYMVQEGNFLVPTFDVPPTMAFADEKVPLHDEEVKQRLDRELHINSYWHSSTIFLIKRANEWFPQIEPVLKQNNIPDDFKYISLIESGLLNVRSPSGAIGFWQILEATGKELGLEINEEVDERYHPLKSTEAASKYFLKAYNKFGNWTNAAASYNIGISGLSRILSEQKMDSYYDLYLNEETARYILRVIALKEIIENKATYGYDVPENQLYHPIPLKEVTVSEDIPDLVKFALEQGVSYKVLKHYNPWLRQKTLTIKKGGGSYTILIPASDN